MPPSTNAAPQTDLNGLRILVAEDESMIAADLEAMLQQLGCDVVGPVPTVQEIVRIAQSEQLDGALLDVNLRGEQVFEALPGLQRLDVPVVLSSGYDDAALFPPQFRDLPRLMKPFDQTELRDICRRNFLRGRSS